MAVPLHNGYKNRSGLSIWAQYLRFDSRGYAGCMAFFWLLPKNLYNEDRRLRALGLLF